MTKADEHFAQVVEALRAGRSAGDTARSLVQLFDFKRRGKHQRVTVDRALRRYGLITEPDFKTLYIDLPFTYRLKGSPSTSPEPTTEPQTEPGPLPTPELPQDFANITQSDPTFRLGQLAAANLAANQKQLIIASPNATLEEAATLMLANDFSQLPVVVGRQVKGTISWKSIGQRLAMGKDCKEVRHAMDSPAAVLDAGVSLFDAIPTIIQHDYVLVRQPDGIISGIVTTSDLSVEFRQQTEPFLILGEVENHLRDLINARFTKSQLKAAKFEGDADRDVQDASDLTFGEYLRLLENPENGDRLKLNLDRTTFRAYIDKVRAIRNDVMHFDPDGIGEDDLDRLRTFVAFLQRLRQMGLF